MKFFQQTIRSISSIHKTFHHKQKAIYDTLDINDGTLDINDNYNYAHYVLIIT